MATVEIPYEHADRKWYLHQEEIVGRVRLVSSIASADGMAYRQEVHLRPWGWSQWHRGARIAIAAGKGTWQAEQLDGTPVTSTVEGDVVKIGTRSPLSIPVSVCELLLDRTKGFHLLEPVATRALADSLFTSRA